MFYNDDALERIIEVVYSPHRKILTGIQPHQIRTGFIVTPSSISLTAFGKSLTE